MDSAITLAGARRLLQAVEHEPVYHQGVSEEAFARLREIVSRMERMDEEAFDLPPRGDPEVRQTIRFMVALLPEEVPDDRVPAVIADVVNNPALAPAGVLDILEGARKRAAAPSRLDVPKLRAAGRLLRQGVPQSTVADRAGVSREVVNRLAVFLGAADAHVEYLRERAAEFSSARAFARAMGLGQHRARTIYQEVKEQLS